MPRRKPRPHIRGTAVGNSTTHVGTDPNGSQHNSATSHYAAPRSPPSGEELVPRRSHTDSSTQQLPTHLTLTPQGKARVHIGNTVVDKRTTSAGRDLITNDGGGPQTNVTHHNYPVPRRPPAFVSSLGRVSETESEVDSPAIPRDDVLDGIDNAFQRGHQRYVLHGPKGVGKSTAAHQYAAQWLRSGRPWMPRDDAEQRHVRWFSAGNPLELLSEYHTFAESCFDGVPFRGRPLDEICPIVNAFLTKVPNVLFVFDGVEDSTVVEQLVGQVLSIHRGGVFVLVTTLHAAMYGMLDPSCRSMLDAFTDEQVDRYLTDTLRHSWGAHEIAELQRSTVFKRHLNGHPMRLHWLSALVRNKPTMTVQRLLDLLQDAFQRRAADPVFTVVVDGLIEHCERTQTCGWTVLRYAARLAHHPIPVELLQCSMGITEDELDAAIHSLRRFSLCITTMPPSPLTNDAPGLTASIRCLSLHSLAHGEVANYDDYHGDATPTHKDMDASLFLGLHALTNSTTDRPSSDLQLRLLFLHITYLLPNRDLVANNFVAAIHLFLRASAHMAASCDFQQALKYAIEAHEMMRKVLRGDHSLIATSLNIIGCHHSALGDHAQALRYALEALEMRRKVLPDPHPDIASSLNNIGNHYSNLGDHPQALGCATEALEMMRKVLPNPHRDIATALCNIGCHYRALGDRAHALKCSMESLEMRRKVLPDPHPDIAKSLNNISSHHTALGDHVQALKYALEALEMFHKVLPDPHPDIVTSLSNISSHHSALGDHAQALKCAVEAYEMARKVLPELHPNIAIAEKRMVDLRKKCRLKNICWHAVHTCIVCFIGVSAVLALQRVRITRERFSHDALRQRRFAHVIGYVRCVLAKLLTLWNG